MNSEPKVVENKTTIDFIKTEPNVPISDGSVPTPDGVPPPPPPPP